MGFPWSRLSCESTGVLLTKETAQSKIYGGAPAKEDSQNIIMGINQEDYYGSEDFVSCVSCTKNGLNPMVKAIHYDFDIQEALMTTLHAMTATKAVVEFSSRKYWQGWMCCLCKHHPLLHR